MSTELATTPAKAPATLRAHLEGDAFKAAVARALPTHMKPERFIGIALTAMTTVPKLKDCTQATFFAALLKLSQLGLEPDGRHAHLIPYKNGKASAAAGRDVYDCQLIVDWKGLSALIYRSGIVSTLHADVVRRGDVFRYSMGVLDEHVPHYLRTDDAKPADAGEIFAVYSTATMKDGERKTEVMSVAEVEAIRKRSRAGSSGPWVTDWNEMAKKTVFRRLSKWLPLSPELHAAVSADDDAIDIPATPKVGMSAMLELDMPTDESPAIEEAKS